jgi:acetyl-CoA C-acetyltransferase
MDPARTPVLIGAGQVTQREPDFGRAPLDLTADAARFAAADAAGDAGAARLLDCLDTIVVIRSFSQTSWRFASPFGDPANPPKSLAARLDASAARRLVYTWPGGNMPQWCVNRLCADIAAGRAGAALVAGGEALATQKAAQRAAVDLDWAEDAGGAPDLWGVATRGWSDVEERHRMAGAIFAYPLFENAVRGALGRTGTDGMAEHQAAMGALFARFAAVAAANPRADRRTAFTGEQIATVSVDNPYIGFPYTRLMNANAFIDQAAAVIVTSAAVADDFGVPADRRVYLHGYADAHDHWYVSDRVDFHSSPAMRLVAREALAMAGLTVADIDLIDLYSCFPAAVEAGCAALGLAEDDPRGLTVTGGLPYFGGPGNNYVTHAVAEMMDRLRARPGAVGLVTGNGNYLTKQSAGLYSTTPPDRPFAPPDEAALQAEIDAVPGPPVTDAPAGPATVETWTVMHDRTGPAYAILYGRLGDGTRFIANTPEDPALLAAMTAQDMLGAPGRVTTTDGHAVFVPD